MSPTHLSLAPASFTPAINTTISPHTCHTHHYPSHTHLSQTPLLYTYIISHTHLSYCCTFIPHTPAINYTISHSLTRHELPIPLNYFHVRRSLSSFLSHFYFFFLLLRLGSRCWWVGYFSLLSSTL